MVAIFEDRGKQYKVKKDDVLVIDKIEKNENDTIEFDKVLLLTEDNDTKIGTPYLKDAKVTATVVKAVRDKKIIVFKFKRRKNYKRTKGHKQPYTLIKIEGITA
ncbi:MAG: 50S ribosomal protein L21 [Spirochaetes bacterium GWD1_27_9]|nr:MAG: 50S ribosomal protein L21 [Spirochaetes bacterium GWB1_27_13]OHD27499.1 MAG: 50S ribosomal protein L21 [Spirochaetes bacterium GWC1_27_15]OHD41693.1 MAG: 50S ribosomal protein L21 [Spirochaetes bacterium GWD1_27_9]